MSKQLDFSLTNGKRAIPGYVLNNEKNWIVYDLNIQKGFKLLDVDNLKELGVVESIKHEDNKVHITVVDNVSKGPSKLVLYTIDNNDEKTWHYGSIIGYLPITAMHKDTTDKSLIAVVIKGMRSVKKKDFDNEAEYIEARKKGGKIMDYTPVSMGAYITCYPYTYRVFEVKEVIDIISTILPNPDRDKIFNAYLMPSNS